MVAEGFGVHLLLLNDDRYPLFVLAKETRLNINH